MVPSKVSYEVPAAIKEELQEATEASQTTIKMEDKVYTIDGTDLNVYKKNKSYSSGNTNPFSDPTKTSNEATSNTTSKVNVNGNTGSTGSTGSTTKDSSSAALSETQINNNITSGSSYGSTGGSEPARTK